MKLIYEKTPENHSKRNSKPIIAIASAIAVCAGCSILLYMSFNPRAVFAEDEPARIETPADGEAGIVVKEAAALQIVEKEEDFVNIEGAHDYSNFEYLIKEIGDNTRAPKTSKSKGDS